MGNNQLQNPEVVALILAAGKGTRMKSDTPKVLHEILGKTLLQWVVDATIGAGIGHQCVVLSQDLEKFESFLHKNPSVSICIQNNRLGTADAVAAAAPYLKPFTVPSYFSGKIWAGEPQKTKFVLICLGDAPAVSSTTLDLFCREALLKKVRLAVLGMDHPVPKGYGRLICDQSGHLRRIVEEKQASEEERAVTLCNTGIIFAEVDFLFELLCEIHPQESNGEYYLTDCFAKAVERGEKIMVFVGRDYQEFSGINDQAQLLELSDWMLQKRGKI